MRAMKRPVLLLALAALSCGKSDATKRRELAECTAVTVDLNGAATCLEAQFRWKRSEALVGARQYLHERDSLAQAVADSLWRLDAKRHRREIDQCRLGAVSACLQENFGWAAPRAKATDDSIWRVEAPKHREQMRACGGRKDMGIGACLQLYYKWGPDRAIALDDSIRRAEAQRTR